MLTKDNEKRGTKATAIEIKDVYFNYDSILEFPGNILCAVS